MWDWRREGGCLLVDHGGGGSRRARGYAVIVQLLGGGLARGSVVCGGGLGVVEDWRELGGLEVYLEVDGGEDGHHNVHLESGV